MVKKTAVKKTDKVSEPIVPVVVATAPESTVEEKPRVIFAPEVEKTETGMEQKPAETAPVGVVVDPTPAVVEAVNPPEAVHVQEPAMVEPVTVGGEVKDVVGGPEKFDVPAGELARSIETLSKIVDQDKPAGVTSVVDSPTATMKPERKRRGGGGALGVLLAFVIGLCLGLVAGYGLWGRYVTKGVSDLLNSVGRGGQQQEVVAQPTPVVSPTPAAVAMERKDLKIKVLNGTGGRGVAALGKEYLEGLGYVEVGTGNAKRSDYEKTEVVLSTAKTAYWPTLKADLEEKYTLVDGFSTDDELLTANGGVDALVIIGE